MIISSSGNIDEYFGEVEWRIGIEHILEYFDDGTGCIHIKQLQYVASWEYPLHHNWVKNKAINHTHPQAFIFHQSSDAESNDTQSEAVENHDHEVKPDEGIGPKLKVKKISPNTEAGTDYDHTQQVN